MAVSFESSGRYISLGSSTTETRMFKSPSRSFGEGFFIYYAWNLK